MIILVIVWLILLWVFTAMLTNWIINKIKSKLKPPITVSSQNNNNDSGNHPNKGNN